MIENREIILNCVGNLNEESKQAFIKEYNEQVNGLSNLKEKGMAVNSDKKIS